MSLKIGYKLCLDCPTQIKKYGKRNRCPKCQLAHSIMLEQKLRESRHKPPRMVACKYCQTEFVARSSSHQVCDALPCRAKQYGKGITKTTIPTRAKAELVSARPLGAYSGEKFERKVNEYLRAING